MLRVFCFALGIVVGGVAARSRAFFARYSRCILQERNTAQARASLYWQRVNPSVTVGGVTLDHWKPVVVSRVIGFGTASKWLG